MLWKEMKQKVYLFAGATVIKCHRLGNQSNRHLFLPSSGSYKLEMKTSAGQLFSEAPLLGW